MGSIDPDQIKSHFDSVAADYDRQRRGLIPCFDDFYGSALKLTQMAANPANILDLGAGTGLFSEMIANKYPEANIRLMDLSDEMLSMARERFKGNAKIGYIIGDYLNDPVSGPYDLVVSSLSIHHLNAAEKSLLFAKVYKLLNPGGVFINADQVLGPDVGMDAFYKSNWKEAIENSGLSYEELEQADQRTKLDKMSTMEEQIQWLKNAGFDPVDVVYKSYSFTVMYGKKPLLIDTDLR